MNEFRQHIPAFVDVDRPPPIAFETTSDLLLLDVVMRYKETPVFSHFAMDENTLIVVRDDGFNWWVVGYIKHPDDVDLPKWDGGRYKAVDAYGGETVIAGSAVSSVCGDEIRTDDGRLFFRTRSRV